MPKPRPPHDRLYSPSPEERRRADEWDAALGYGAGAVAIALAIVLLAILMTR